MTKQQKWILGGLAYVVAVLFYATNDLYRQQQVARISVVKTPKQAPYKQKLAVGLKATKTKLKAGETGKLSLELKDQGFKYQVAGIEGRLEFNPKVIKITKVDSKSLPVKLQTWKVRKISDELAEVSFAFGAGVGAEDRARIKLPKMATGGGREVCTQEYGSCVSRSGSCVTYSDGCEKARLCDPAKIGIKCRATQGVSNGKGYLAGVGLVEFEYKAVAGGESWLRLPGSKLKLAGLYGDSLLDESGSRLGLKVWIVADKPKPEKRSRFDLNGDGKVDLLDYNLFMREFRLGGKKLDFNSDGKVDVLDYGLFLNQIRQNWMQLIY